MASIAKDQVVSFHYTLTDDNGAVIDSSSGGEPLAYIHGNGNLVPADPALLNIGKLGFLSSQAHAHYGLPQLQFSDDPEMLKTDPRRFAVASGYPKGPILTLAAEMSQLHTDLAMLAVLTVPTTLATPLPEATHW